MPVGPGATSKLRTLTRTRTGGIDRSFLRPQILLHARNSLTTSLKGWSIRFSSTPLPLFSELSCCSGPHPVGLLPSSLRIGGVVWKWRAKIERSPFESSCLSSEPSTSAMMLLLQQCPPRATVISERPLPMHKLSQRPGSGIGLAKIRRDTDACGHGHTTLSLALLALGRKTTMATRQRSLLDKPWIPCWTASGCSHLASVAPSSSRRSSRLLWSIGSLASSARLCDEPL